MSATPVLGFIKAIAARDVATVRERLVNQHQSPNQRFTDAAAANSSYALLHKAVAVGCADIVAALLDAGADVNARDSQGRTPLHWLAGGALASSSSEHLAVAQQLLEQRGVDMHAVSASNATALHEAAAAANAPMLRLLLARGSDPCNTAPGFTALHAACAQPCAAGQAPAPAQAQQRQPPLVLSPAPRPPAAAASSSLRQGKGTAAAGATSRQPAARSGDRRTTPAAATAISRAAAGTAAVQTSSPLAAPPSPPQEQQHTRAAAAGTASSSQLHTAVVDELLRAAPQLLGQQDCEGFTPLMRLLQRGAWPDAHALLARGHTSINAASTSTGDTALHLLAGSARPDLQLVAALAAAGANAHAQRRQDGSSPLLLAVKQGGEAGLALARAMLQPLHDSSALTPPRTVSSSNSGSGGSALWRSLDDASSNASSCSTAGGIDAPNAAGETALSVAVAALTAASSGSGGSEAQQQLLSLVLAAKPHVPQPIAASLLQQGLAGRLSDELTAQVVACLPDAQAVQAAATAASQPLSFEALLAARLFRTAVAFLLRSKGVDARAQDAVTGETLLHSAVRGPDRQEFVAALLAAGVPASAANKADNDTPLHIAACAGHIGTYVQACRALVAGGADVLARNGKNRTPGAQLKLPEAVATFLREAEASARAAKEDQRHSLYDAKMRATQTQSACALSTL